MKCPRKLTQRAAEILAERWEATQEGQTRALTQLHEEHPEVEEVRSDLRRMYASNVSALAAGMSAAQVNEEVSAIQLRVRSLMESAGIAEADLQPHYICPVCENRGEARGKHAARRF